MLHAFGPGDLERWAIPIGIAVGVLFILIVPAFRRSVLDSYKKGKEARERMLENPPEAKTDEDAAKQ